MTLTQQQKAAVKGSIVDSEVAEALISKLGEAALVAANNVAAVVAPTATDLPTAVALANANKTAINAVIASLIAAGLMKAS